MMEGLQEIRDAVQGIAEAITAALNIDTEIVDDTLTIVAGTGRYLKKIGLKEEGGDLKSGYIYSEALRTGKTYIIEEGESHPTYAPLENELAEVCCPIIMENKVIGLVGLVAFDEEQRKRLLESKEGLLLFLKRMADLLASKLRETQIANQLQAVLDSIYDGILSVNKEGIIVSVNPKATQLLGKDQKELIGTSIFSIWPNSGVLESIRTGARYTDREEITRISMDRINHFITNINPIYSGKNKTDSNSISGAVVSFRDIAEVRQMVYKLTEAEEPSSFQQITGNSLIVKRLREQGKKISGSLSTVLITGESGTGKGLMARAIHASSPVNEGPYIVVNCGAIANTLLESELFGYEEGAFTGAKKTGKIGRFEMANNGTIFLDEIGDMPLHLQIKILHVLQQKEIQRVGGNDYIPVHVRIIAATNRDLEKLVAEKMFREDLFFRLNVIPIDIPPLRERREDIGLLMEQALQKYNRVTGKQLYGFTDKAKAVLLNHDWPGNIRELENVVEYAVTMGSDDLIGIENLPAYLSEQREEAYVIHPLKDQCAAAEKEILENCLRITGYSLKGKIKAAKLLGISESTLYRRIKSLGINAEEGKVLHRARGNYGD